MYLKVICTVLVFVLALTGCWNTNSGEYKGHNAVSDFFDSPDSDDSYEPAEAASDSSYFSDSDDSTESAATAADSDLSEIFNVYYSLNNYEPESLEPEFGCYSGAYILSDKSIGFDISQFELKAGSHGSYKYHLLTGDEFPLSWVLSCYKESKLPFIVLAPSDSNKPFDYDIITEYAKDFGELDIPILLGFYPEPEKNGWSPELYKSFFAYAREEFAKYSPNTSFVFITGPEEAYNADKYIDGKSVDWLGMDLYMPIKDGKPDNSCLSDFNYFYMKYQSQYPIMISALGVSSYSAENHSYFTSKAAEEISSFYKTAKEKYPRLKAVYYMDFDSTRFSDISSKASNSFLITNGDEVTEKYKSAVSDSYFISKLKTENTKDGATARTTKNTSENISENIPENNITKKPTQKNRDSVTSGSAVSASLQTDTPALNGDVKKNSLEDNYPQDILLPATAYYFNRDYYIPADCAASFGIDTTGKSSVDFNGESFVSLSEICTENSLIISKKGDKLYIKNEQ